MESLEGNQDYNPRREICLGWGGEMLPVLREVSNVQEVKASSWSSRQCDKSGSLSKRQWRKDTFCKFTAIDEMSSARIVLYRISNDLIFSM